MLKRWSHVIWFALFFFAAAAPFGCGDDVGSSHDAGADLSVPVGGQPCVRNDDCPSAAFVCAFKIADGCAATGHCAPIPMPTCASFTELCGCDGSPVRAGGCFYADGYAGGPTTGASFCADDGGTHD